MHYYKILHRIGQRFVCGLCQFYAVNLTDMWARIARVKKGGNKHGAGRRGYGDGGREKLYIPHIITTLSPPE